MAGSKSRKKTVGQKRLKLRKSKRLVSQQSPDETNPASTIASALKLQQKGRLDEAQRLYREVLKKDPKNPDAWHLWGMTLFSANEFESAIECLQHTLTLTPNQPDVLANLGVVHRAAGNLEDARRVLEQAVGIPPELANSFSNLGTVYMELGRIEDAETQFEKALSIDSDSKLAAMNLGNLWQDQHRHLDAENVYRSLLRQHPNDALLLNNLGESLRNQGKWEQAVEVLDRAIRVVPDSVELRLNLGRNLAQLRRFEEAQLQFTGLIEQHPDHPKPYHYLGKLILGMGDAGKAVEVISRAVELGPKEPHSLCSLGFALLEIGDRVQAETCFRSALEIDPAFSSAHSTLLFLMSSKSHVSQATLFEEHKEWGEAHGSVTPLKSRRQWSVERDKTKNRKLKIGYVSPDLRNHVVDYYFRPVLNNHDRSQFETFCYAEVGEPDETTETLKQLSDNWRFTTGLSDEQVARQIMSDEIDILIELAGHSSNNRVLALAYRPAPVQVTWLGYPNTTGLKSIDYRITCETQNPFGEPTYHTEELFRMPNGSFCFTPPVITPELSELPAVKNGFITFGSLHRPDKISESTLDLWAGVLQKSPTSKLSLFHTRFKKESMERLVKSLNQRGIAPDRVQIRNEVTGAHYLEAYENIDISLDATPWAGATTTVESLWMGVPVIAFHGDCRSSRSTAAIMKNVKHETLIAHSPDEYASIAKRLSADLPLLNRHRRSLRREVQDTIMNAPNFTREFENSIREMWHRWCIKADEVEFG